LDESDLAASAVHLPSPASKSLSALILKEPRHKLGVSKDEGGPWFETCLRSAPANATMRPGESPHCDISHFANLEVRRRMAPLEGSSPMPLYRFGLCEDNSSPDQKLEWHPNDVAALAAAAQTTAASARDRGEGRPVPMLLAFRMKP
jgi:hypothetical protein